jgi:hypothetical protein
MYMIHGQLTGFFGHILHDTRSERRAEKLMLDLLNYGNAVVNKFCKTHTERIGAYRMLGNQSFDHDALAAALFRYCKKNVEKGHLLGIQDTTEFNFTYHRVRIGDEDPDIGPITNKNSVGFFCHPMLIIDPSNQLPIGISSISIWNRSWETKNRHERDYKNQDIKQKESYRWISGAQQTKELLDNATSITIIGDREADIYEEFIAIPDHKTDLLVRSSYNRRLFGENQNLFEKLSSSPVKATYKLDIPASAKRAKRIAEMSLKFEKVKICHPINKARGKKPEYVELWAIEARELPGSTPQGEDPILWRLLTTHEINVITDALTYVEWYSLRWLIEELFHIIKSKGFSIESAQLEKGASLKKLCVLALQAALIVMTLKLSLKNNHKIKASLLFSEEELTFMRIYMNELEGKTEKLKNPYQKDSVQWAAWGIARLGGWSGYDSQGPPGYITMKNGLDRFNDKVESFLMVMKYFNKKDVYKD